MQHEFAGMIESAVKPAKVVAKNWLRVQSNEPLSELCHLSCCWRQQSSAFMLLDSTALFIIPHEDSPADSDDDGDAAERQICIGCAFQLDNLKRIALSTKRRSKPSPFASHDLWLRPAVVQRACAC